MNVWLFGYGSLIWRPDFEFIERRAARIHGRPSLYLAGSIAAMNAILTRAAPIGDKQ